MSLHGRIKVRTTEEQRELKRQEQLKKLERYNHLVQQANSKRSDKIYDPEARKITNELLEINADYYSIWNYRKEILEHIRDTSDEDTFQEAMNEEIQFTETCLRLNPKSYSSWYQRIWVLENQPKPDWNREMKLCERYLKLDERNFHCWDYRRWIASKANTQPKDELDFCTDKINHNFSNYSAWQYRTKLLPVLYPSKNPTLVIDEYKLLEEVELVRNAIYTDPDDQSAWFYLKWLIKTADLPLKIGIVLATTIENRIVIVLTRPVKERELSSRVSLVMNSCPMKSQWTPFRTHNEFSCIWECQLQASNFPSGDRITVTVYLDNGANPLEVTLPDPAVQRKDAIAWDQDMLNVNLWGSIQPSTSPRVYHAVLSSIEELRSLEPNSLNVLLMLLIVSSGELLGVGSCHDYAEFNSLIEELRTYKPQRAAFIESIINRLCCGRGTMCLRATQSQRTQHVLFIVEEISELHFLEQVPWVRKLSCKGVRWTRPIASLTCLEDVEIVEGSVTTLEGFTQLRRLRKLNLTRQNLWKAVDFSELQSCKLLRKLYIGGNPIINDSAEMRSLSAMLPEVNISTETEVDFLDSDNEVPPDDGGAAVAMVLHDAGEGEDEGYVDDLEGENL